MKNDYGMKTNIFTIANARLCKSEMTNMYAVCLLWETQKVLWNQKIYVSGASSAFVKIWLEIQKKEKNEWKKNVIIDNNKNRTFTIVVWICKILLLFVWLVFSFWWFRLSKLKLDAIFICLKIDLGCQPKQSYLIARIHIIHLSRSRAFISIILILNTRKYSFKITLYHWPCFSFPIRGLQCQLKVSIQLPPERILFFLSEN